MSGLAELQRRFAESVAGKPDPILDALVDDGRQADRFDVYRNNTFASLREVLANTFPAIVAIIGEDLFGRLSAAFVRHAPPRANHLLDYGAELPGFIALSEPLQRWPFLADVARLEWAVNAAYGAPEATPVDPSGLSGLAPVDLMALCLALHPSAALIASDWPVHAIRMNPQSAADPAAIQPRPEAALVARPETEVICLPLHPAEQAFLAALAEGRTLGEAAERCQQADPGFDLQGALARHLAGGLFVRAGHDEEGEPK
ncbi:DNA-binding domain-containing protein [Minwuia thermotolerans]|uniref:HvfC/BufC N-terminal domain-containing protein n=1 Tax=Minwuia thermotolerans TaxID=2056226 RepID=UPI0013DE24AB|nr:DNA-binding domain-containing protein [Minwuia thermotolerans]